jgi:hypothetical protein
MRIPLVFLSLMLVEPKATPSGQEQDLTFDGTRYSRRWSRGPQHEYTPAGQDDLTMWKDMVTLIGYPKARTPGQMAMVAHELVSIYTRHSARVLRVDAIPATQETAAMYFVAALFIHSTFVEAVFARLELVDGEGAAVLYSHREYGEVAVSSHVMSQWLETQEPHDEQLQKRLSHVYLRA